MQSVLQGKIRFTVVKHNADQTDPKERKEKHLTLLIQYFSGCLKNWIQTGVKSFLPEFRDFTTIQTVKPTNRLDTPHLR